MDTTATGEKNMKRFGSLWSQITDFPNLVLASRKAQKSKRFRDNVLLFNYELEENLHTLQKELQDHRYRPGPYKTFYIFEPKKRLISAAPYRDRMVQHALCNIIEPIFDRSLSGSCFANRKGKGTHKALVKFIKLSKKYRFCLKMDVRRYFPSMDHSILKEIIRRKIKCQDTLWLIDLILDSSNPQEDVYFHFPGDDLFMPLERRRGLPIGNLTSQMWANVYLMQLDHEMTRRFGSDRYIRYVDDMVLFSNDREELCDALQTFRDELEKLRLCLHERKTELIETRRGVNFLGFRVFPNRVRIIQENLKRARRRLKKMQIQYANGELGADKIWQSLRSWVAHLEWGDTWRLRERIFASLVFRRRVEGKGAPDAAGRLVV